MRFLIFRNFPSIQLIDKIQGTTYYNLLQLMGSPRCDFRCSHGAVATVTFKPVGSEQLHRSRIVVCEQPLTVLQKHVIIWGLKTPLRPSPIHYHKQFFLWMNRKIPYNSLKQIKIPLQKVFNRFNCNLGTIASVAIKSVKHHCIGI